MTDNKMGFFKVLRVFLWVRKKFWLLPIIFVILVLGGLFTLAKDDKALYRFFLSVKPNIQQIYITKFTIGLKNFQVKKFLLFKSETLVVN